jgi:hypothetical protein
MTPIAVNVDIDSPQEEVFAYDLRDSACTPRPPPGCTDTSWPRSSGCAASSRRRRSPKRSAVLANHRGRPTGDGVGGS